MTFEFKCLSHPEVQVIVPEVFSDDRGYLLETFDEDMFKEAGINEEFVLDFYSQSRANVLRGLHVQTEPAAQAKLVHVIQGAVFDVVVDVRPESNRFGEYVTRRLSGDDKEILYIPAGFAHGYLVLEDDTLVHYKGSHSYAPKHIQGIAWDDPDLSIKWPIDGNPALSDKDLDWPTLREWNP
ncbi:MULTISPECIES: dTDP-4-dehydrorhamnose 3,5-epimerase [unclassified Natrinema]|uniref:dTDP-4-dehydrorhamnose 3,5-epimerase n=1 Tax=unclassified Natrinema TaxID=2622230 RepID=UPI00026D47E0|nr:MULTISPECIES: dTDP-4-dehydrorhamnose 3,5-epimerase [unclassified Natrinema]AFO59135.1 dTDP-4-dehydrorhamnose 3,5-epimerase [Natrinema sp. J7-2]